MNKTLIASVMMLGIGLSSFTFAGHHKGAHDRSERHLERMTEQLELSSEQQEQMREIHKQQREAYRELHAQTREQVAEVLTEEQQEIARAINRRTEFQVLSTDFIERFDAEPKE